MAKGGYLGISSKAKKIKKIYIGVGGKAKKVKKAYIGVGGKAKLCWSGADGTFLITNFNSFNSGSPRIGKIDRSSLTLTVINNTSVGFKQIVYCQGRWFAVRDEYGSSTYTYLVYSSDGVTWTKLSTGVGSFLTGNLCADSEYVYLRTTYSGGSWAVVAINATTLAVTSILSGSYYQYGEPFITHDNKILFSSSYYNGSTTVYESTLVTRNGSSFSNQKLSARINQTCVYGSSNEKTILIGYNNYSNYISYYKNGSITLTQVKYQGKASQGSGIVYGNGVFTDGIHVSSDGITWSESTIGTTDYNLIGYGDGVFIKIAQGTTDYYHVTVSYSEDCTNWTVLGEIDTGSGTAFSNRYASCSYDIAKGYGDK